MMEDMSDLTQAASLAADAQAGAGRNASGRNGHSRTAAGAAGGVPSIEGAVDPPCTG